MEKIKARIHWWIYAILMTIIVIGYFASCCDGLDKKNKEIERLNKELEEVRGERDILSDAIRSSYDSGEKKGYETAYELLEECGFDTCLTEWSYCY